MSETLLDLKEFYWANRGSVLMVAGAIGLLCVQFGILVWTLRQLSELGSIRERLSRLADGLVLLTDTTEAGLASLAAQIEALGPRARPARSAARAAVAKRVVEAARSGERAARIAERETISESEVRLHLALSDRPEPSAQPPLAS